MEQRKNNMATASMVIGILSIVLTCCCFMGFAFGALAILFACLSRVDDRMEGKAKAGLITGIVGMVLGVVSFFVWLIILGSNASSGLNAPMMNYGLAPVFDAWWRGGLL